MRRLTPQGGGVSEVLVGEHRPRHRRIRHAVDLREVAGGPPQGEAGVSPYLHRGVLRVDASISLSPRRVSRPLLHQLRLDVHHAKSPAVATREALEIIPASENRGRLRPFVFVGCVTDAQTLVQVSVHL